MARDGRRTTAQCRHGRRRASSGVSLCEPPTSIDAGEREDHHGGVGFTGEFAVGKLLSVDRHPLYRFDRPVGSPDLWVPRVSDCRIRFCVILFLIFVLTSENYI